MRALARSWILLLATCLSLAGGRLCAQDRIRMRACVDSCSRAMSAGAVDRALEQVKEAMVIAEALNDSIAIAEVLVKKGNIRMMQGDYNNSLLDLQKALRIYEAAQHLDGMATVYTSIGSIHFYDRNYARAQQYYLKGLAIREQLRKPTDIATLIGNLGSVMEEMGRPDSALAYHRRHLAMRRAAGQQNWLPICYTNLGVCFDKMGQSDSALHYLETSVDMYPKSDRQNHALCQALTMLGVARLNAGQPRVAVQECRRALAFAEELDDLPMMEQGYRCLYRAYDALGDAPNALAMYKRYIAARDSMSGEQRAKELLRLELTYHFENERLTDSLRSVDEQRQAEFAYQHRLTKERDQKRFFLFGAIGVLVLAGGLWSRLRYVRRSRSIIQRERDRSESLLLNILPKPIADELKAHGRAKARDVDGVSILFTDFHDFTRMSERLNAHELVEEIDACFRAFDGIVARHRLEKIKTIGDAYMCAGGLPEPRPGSVHDTVLAALEMQDWMKARAAERCTQGLPCFSMRAGIHTGAVVAGIVGDSKFQYDIWGDTVNTAAHMESAGAVGEVNISEATFGFVQESADLVFSPRGRIEAKGKGELAMFFVRRAGPPSIP